MTKHYKRGYTAGVFDVLHVGHINLLRNAKSYCDHLIVGVNSDELVMSYKNKYPIETLEERMTVVGAIRYVDDVVANETLDKVEAYMLYDFDAVFIGDDWKGNERWLATEKALSAYGVDVVYLPHTDGISSTQVRKKLEENT